MLYTKEAINKRKEKVKKIQKIISIIAYILLIPLLIYNISLIVQAATNPNKTPSFFGFKTYAILSGSMEPDIKTGDIVIVKEADISEIKTGDVISFRRGETIITHRITEILEDTKTYKTKGDNNNVEDSVDVEFGSIEGKVVGRIPLLGSISQVFRGKVTMIAIAFMAYIYFSHTSKTNRRKNMRKVKRLKHEENEIKGE